jgi:hypothetical protein
MASRLGEPGGTFFCPKLRRLFPGYVHRARTVILNGVPQRSVWWCGTEMKNPVELPATMSAWLPGV